MTIQKSKFKSQNCNSKVKTFAFFLVLLTFTFFLFPLHSAFAQTQGINLTVSPVFVSLVTEPGKDISSQVKIRNNSNARESLRVKLATFETGPDGKPLLKEVEKDDEFVSWLDLSDDSFTLAPNETKTIRLKVSPPTEAALGYYYALVFTRAKETKEGQEVPQAVIAASPAIPLLVEVKSKNTKRELQLADFKTDKLFYEYLPTTFTITLKNTGNIHSVPVGDIFIDSSYREDIAVIPVNQGHGNVLPSGTRSFTVDWKDGFAVRTPQKDGAKVTYRTNYDFSKANKFRIGKYRAHALLIYDNGERDIPLEATVSFWVVPWKIIGIALVILYFVFVGVKDRISGFIRRLRR